MHTWLKSSHGWKSSIMRLLVVCPATLLITSRCIKPHLTLVILIRIQVPTWR
jgi:hypothetical protein